MKIAVIGGSGFLGKEIVNLLGSQENEVACLHRNEHLGCNTISKFDLFNPERVVDFLNLFRPEVVIITAWVTNSETYKTDSSNQSYQIAIENLASQLISKMDFHLLVLGSGAEYGLDAGPCASSISNSSAGNPYSKAKIDCLQNLREIFANVNSRLTWLRVFQPYGLNQDVSRLIPSAINHFKENMTFLVKNPNSISDWISSRDVASAVKYCISESTPQVVDVGTGVPTTNIDILNLLRLKMGAPQDLLILPTNSRAFSLYLDIKNSFLHKVGWTPKDDISHGIDWILESCQ
jgi:nucleoside-diphosphate-sugar epimerase